MKPTPQQAFRDAAHMLCELFEHEHRLSPRQWLTTTASMLAALVSQATQLPQLEGSAPADAPSARLFLYVPEDVDRYWLVSDASIAQPVAASLTHDFTEIHRGLSRGLAAFDAGEVDGAIAEWSSGYRSGWGRHAVSALRALRAYLERAP